MSITDVLSVLVVDDDFRVASVHQGFVERIPGFRVVGQAHSAVQALDRARSLRPDIVLMDVYLPDGDGLQVVQDLLTDADPPSVVVISAATEVATVRRAVQLGAMHYLVKPFSFAALAERLASVRAMRLQLAALTGEATQEEISRIFERLRPPVSTVVQSEDRNRLAPTLRAVLRAVSESDAGMSATEVADSIGISRATAQRALAQLEQSGLVHLELRYGHTGRPEHRYSAP